MLIQARLHQGVLKKLVSVIKSPYSIWEICYRRTEQGSMAGMRNAYRHAGKVITGHISKPATYRLLYRNIVRSILSCYKNLLAFIICSGYDPHMAYKGCLWD